MAVVYNHLTTQNGGVPLSTYSKGTATELPALYLFMLSAEQEAVNIKFSKS